MSTQIPLWRIIPSRWQPRESQFDADRLLELAQSIRAHGLITPISVFLAGDDYELIAGERRTRACLALVLVADAADVPLASWIETLAQTGLPCLTDAAHVALQRANAHIAAHILPADDLPRLHISAVLENLEREDLTALEEARGYQSLLDAHGWSQRQLAARLGKSQGYVGQRLMLLAATPAVQQAVITRVINLAQARAIAGAPAALQAPLTEWAVAALQRNDSPATSRQVARRAQQLTAFVNPARWEPDAQRSYRPRERNRLAILQQALADADISAGAGELLALADYGYAHKNLLKTKPCDLVDDWAYVSGVLRALDVTAQEEQLLAALGRTCATCALNLLNELPAAERDANSGLREFCPRGAAPETAVCSKYVGSGDPVIIPLRRYATTHAARGLPELRYVAEPFEHLTEVADIPVLLAAIRAHAAQQSAADTARDARKYIESIRGYHEWQAALPAAWRAHFQAHACEKCVNFAPELAAQGEPPCRIVGNPLQIGKTGYGQRDTPEFGCLVAGDGQLAPRCETFAYRAQPVFFAPLHWQFPSRHSVLGWLRTIVHEAKSSYTNHVLWGALSWLDYGRKIGKNAVSWPALQRWLLAHWDELGAGGVAGLLDIAVAELAVFQHSAKTAFTLLDAEGSASTWRRCEFPFARYREYEYLAPEWPADWPRPWVVAEEADSDG